MKTPILETERLILHPFCMEDAKEVFECWESDPDVAKYMFWTSHNDINKTVEWVKKEISKIESDDWYRWAFISKKTGELYIKDIPYECNKGGNVYQGKEYILKL